MNCNQDTEFRDAAMGVNVVGVQASFPERLSDRKCFVAYDDALSSPVSAAFLFPFVVSELLF